MRMATGLKVCIENMTVLIELYIQNEFCTHLFSLTSSVCQAIRRWCYAQSYVLYTACDVLHMAWGIWCTPCLQMWFICCFLGHIGPWSYNFYVWDPVYGQFRQ